MVTEYGIRQLISEARAMRGRAFILHEHALQAPLAKTKSALDKLPLKREDNKKFTRGWYKDYS